MHRHSPRTRVLHVVLHLDVGGAEMLVNEFVRSMDPERFEGSVCCLKHRGELGEKLLADGFRVSELQAPSGLRAATVAAIRRIVRDESIDVLHAHTYTPFFFAALAKPLGGGVRLVFTEHGRLYPERENVKRQLINPFLVRRADHIVSISRSTRKSMAVYDNFPLDRIEVIHNGVSLQAERNGDGRRHVRDSLDLDPGVPVVGMAARVVPLKNFPMALRALKRVHTVLPETHLVIAGDGPELPELKRLSRELRLESRVRFLGMRDDLRALYPAFDLFALASLTEGVSITLLEAMARGVPAVVTDVGGNPEVVRHGETGLLVPSGDHDAMAAAIVNLLRAPERRARMGRNGVRRVHTEFSYQRMFDEYARRYRRDIH